MIAQDTGRAPARPKSWEKQRGSDPSPVGAAEHIACFAMGSNSHADTNPDDHLRLVTRFRTLWASAPAALAIQVGAPCLDTRIPLQHLFPTLPADSTIPTRQPMTSAPSAKPRITQCQKPEGLLGRFVLRNMNARHSGVTDWGLAQISIQKHFAILDIGCGGGRTVSKLAAIATEGKVYGVDYSPLSVAVASKANKESIKNRRVEIREGSVSQLPFATDTFDLVVAVETHFWWPDLLGDLKEILRVLKPGGELAIIAEVYKGASTPTAKFVEKYLPRTGLKLLTIEEHRDLLTTAGYANVQITTESNKGWIFASGKKNEPQAT